MRVTQRMMVDTARVNIGRNAENLNTLQDQLASGKRLRRASDDPASLSTALSLRRSSSQIKQYLRNVTTTRGWMEASDSGLDQMASVLSRARSLAIRSASDTLGDDERERLAVQVEGLIDEVQQAGNTTYEGKFVFAGTKTTAAPFDSAASPIYQGDSGQMTREIDRGVTVPVNTLSSEIQVTVTDAGGATSSKGVIEGSLTVLLAMKAQLETGGPVTSAQLGQLTECLDSVSELRGSVGARVARLDATEKTLTDNQVDIAASLSRAEDADVAEVMTKLMMQETVYNAALQAGARVIQPSLWDFLS